MIEFLSGLLTSFISASLSMCPDTVLSRIGFSEMVRLWEQKFLVYQNISGSISSNRLNLSLPRFSSVIAFVRGSIQFTAPFSHRKPFIPLSAGIQPLACAALLLTHTVQMMRLISHNICSNGDSFRCSLPRSGSVRFAHDGRLRCCACGAVSALSFFLSLRLVGLGAPAGCFGLGLSVWAVARQFSPT